MHSYGILIIIGTVVFGINLLLLWMNVSDIRKRLYYNDLFVERAKRRMENQQSLIDSLAGLIGDTAERITKECGGE